MSTRSAAFTLRQQAETLAGPLPPLLVAAQRVAATVTQGVHGRRRVGLGETFWQFRRYQAGDSVTAIDWRQSAKSEPVFVRENEWAAAQSLWLWCDRSPSMDYRSAPGLPTKRARAELLTLALAVLLVRGGERVALLNWDPRAATGRYALDRMAARLSAPPTAGEGSLPVSEPLPRHARLVLMGDFLGPLADIQAMVNGLVGRAVRGHLLQILDPAEETLPFGGRVAFEGLEGERGVLVPRVEAIQAAYLKRMAAQRDGLATIARLAGWTFSDHATHRPPEPALLSLYGALVLEGE